ncbi:ABC transporter substrate-binding protein [Pseudonocardia sp. GCM10023141]|uniref:ABC transporter substrate-binding protein n=1 Tax=Pseudonocardia sp. GCM10023141 TaxID=3252653 RepID=UPI003620A1DE
MSRPRALVLAAAAVLFAVTACSSAQPGTAPSGEKPAITVGIDSALSNLNPALDNRGNDGSMIIRTLAYDPLLRTAPDGSFTPGLATSWKYIDDKRTVFELTLRTGAAFSDGMPVNAAAVKTWLEYYANSGGAFSKRLKISSIETEGDSIVRLHMAAPEPTLLTQLSDMWTWGLIGSPAAVAKPDQLKTQTFGAGPYMLDPKETVEGDHNTYVPNPHYYDQSKIRFSKIVIKIVVDPASMLQAATTGQLDVALGQPSMAAGAVSAGLNVIHKPFGSSEIYFMDRAGTLVKPLGDAKVRQALNYAIDRKAIAQGLANGYAAPITAHYTDDAWNQTKADAAYPFDPEKAKSLLAEAGYPNGFSFKIVTVTTGNRQNEALAVAENLRKVGVTMEVVTVPAAQFIDEMKKGVYSAFYTTRKTSMAWDVGNDMWSNVSITDPFKLGRPAQLDVLYNETLAAKDPAPYLTQMADYVTDQSLTLPVLLQDSVWFAKPGIEGIDFGFSKPAPFIIDWIPKG